MRILLIGATGQIGYALTRALSETLHQTSVLVRNKPKLGFPGNVRVLEARAFTADTFKQALREVDCAVYAVGLPERFSLDDQIFQQINYGIFKTFVETLKQSDVRRLVYISTYEVFQPMAGVIRETHPIADQGAMTPYFKAMTQAYALALETAQELDLALTTIHPAAVYGGRNTGDGFTNYIENLLNWRVWKIPVIIAGRFPIVHTASLATAIVHSLDKTGAYIVSDQMTSLSEMALTLRENARSYIPPTVPLRMVRSATAMLEFFARLFRIRPIMARVQLEFITKGWEPRPDRAQEDLGWKPKSLSQGLQNYLRERTSVIG